MSASFQTIQTLIPPDFIDLSTGDPNPRLLPLELLRDAAAYRLGVGGDK